MVETGLQGVVASLRKTLAWSDLVLANLSEAVLIINDKLEIMFSNESAAGILGKSPVYIAGSHFWDAVKMEPRKRVAFPHTIPEGQNLGYYSMTLNGQWLMQVNGDERIMSVFSASISDSNAIIVLSDITRQVNDEEALRLSAEQLRLILDSVKDGITFSDPSGKFVIYNQEMVQLTGYTKEEADAMPDFYSAISTRPGNWGNELDAQGELLSQTEIKTKDGKIRQLLVGTRLVAYQGQRMFLSSYHDVTELETARRELHQANTSLEQRVQEKTDELTKRMRELEEAARFPEQNPSPAFKIDEKGLLIYSNPAGQSLLIQWQTPIGARVPENIFNILNSAMGSRMSQTVDVEVGEKVYAFHIVPFPDEKYANIYTHDVTRERQIDKMKSEFISLASHQLRTPLTSMRWYSEMLLKQADVLPEKALKQVNVLHETAAQLASLVNDLLDLNRLDSGELQLTLTSQPISQAVHDVIEQLRGQAEAGNITLIANVNTNVVMSYDLNLVRQVYMNLISNALKYTKPGGSVQVTVDQYENGEIHSEVTDSGIGIPKAQQEQVFGRFFRASNASESGKEGTGLGLALVKMILQRSGGTIWFLSEENVGTAFHFTLPFRQ